MGSVLRRPFDDLVAGMEKLVAGERPWWRLAVALASLTICWFVYVPIHELLHVAGCVWTGGAVSELQIQPVYGGAILARFFDFVVVGGEYSGRLSGFDTGGSDGVYLATDFAPYLLSVVLGVPLLQRAARARRPGSFGVGVTVGLAPFYSLIGDYYEMGSILVTRIVATALGQPPQESVFTALRSDDLLLLVERLFSQPAALGLEAGAEVATAAFVVAAATLLGAALAFATYWAGVGFAEKVWRTAPAPAEATPREPEVAED